PSLLEADAPILNYASGYKRVVLSFPTRRSSDLALTGLANRRVLDRLRTEIWAGQERAGSAILLDVDGYKSFNDIYGHLDGDACLDRKSTRLNSSHENKSYPVFCLKKKRRPQVER